VVCCVMVSKILGISCVSSRCDGIYIFRIIIGVRGGLLSFNICRYGEISRLVGIFEILLGYVYLVLIKVSNPIWDCMYMRFLFVGYILWEYVCC
jgi:hypothetical protein